MNHKMIYALRTESRPKSHAALARLYEDPRQLRTDLDQLRRHQLIRLDGQGVQWTGT